MSIQFVDNGRADNLRVWLVAARKVVAVAAHWLAVAALLVAASGCCIVAMASIGVISLTDSFLVHALTKIGHGQPVPAGNMGVLRYALCFVLLFSVEAARRSYRRVDRLDWRVWPCLNAAAAALMLVILLLESAFELPDMVRGAPNTSDALGLVLMLAGVIGCCGWWLWQSVQRLRRPVRA